MHRHRSLFLVLPGQLRGWIAADVSMLLHQCQLWRLPCNFIQGGETIGEVALSFIEEVHGAIFDLSQLMTAYHSMSRLNKLLKSTLFKRRHDELNAVVDQAIIRLQVSAVPPRAPRAWTNCCVEDSKTGIQPL